MGGVAEIFDDPLRGTAAVLTLGQSEIIRNILDSGEKEENKAPGGLTGSSDISPVGAPPPAPKLDDASVAGAGSTAQVDVNADPITGKPKGAASQILAAPIVAPPGSLAGSYLGDVPSYKSNKKRLGN